MATQIEPIQGKIAKILNSREVALNIGGEQGVTHGMLFEILSPKGIDILDPDTGIVLGSVPMPKTRVKVNRVYDKLSVAATYRTTRVNVGGAGISDFSVPDYFRPPKWQTRYETLKYHGGFEISPEDLAEEDSYVGIGDPVVQVIEDD